MHIAAERSPRSALRPSATFAAMILASVCWAGCSAIVSTSDDDIRCAVVGGVDPCPEGRRCIDSYCQPPPTVDAGVDSNRPDTSGCVPTADTELCGGGDENCNGETDEGHDLDEDGATWCGGGRGPQFADCDDSNPDVRPADPENRITPGIELCNGIDEDCDGRVDEGSRCQVSGEECFSGVCYHPDDCRRPEAQCDAGQSCDTTTTPPSCRAGDCTVDGCPGAQVCDNVTRSCVSPQPPGSACATDAECTDAVCVDRDAAGLDTSAPAMLCATACCTDLDCPSATICWNSGTGAKLCIAEGLLGRTRGVGISGDTCDAAEDCASSICARGSSANRCLGNCSESMQCGEALRCQLVSLTTESSEVALNACLGPIGTGAPGGPCFRDGDCEYGICLAVGTGTGVHGVCGGSCGQSRDCGESGELYCGFLSGTDSFSNVPICLPKNHVGEGTTGSTCSEADDCNDRGCVDGRCLDSCCEDGQCDGVQTCRPHPAGGGSFRMRCSG